MFTTFQEAETETLGFRVLDASYTMLAYPAFLAGYRTVQEAIADGCLNTYLHSALAITEKSLHDSLSPDDREMIINQVMGQMASSETDSSLADLCHDGASKLSAFIIPTLLDRLEQGKDIAPFAFLLAAYGHYLKAGVDDKGEEYEIHEPQLTRSDWTALTHGNALALFDVSVFASAHLRSFPKLVSAYTSYDNQISRYGLLFSLKQTLCAFDEDEADGRS